MSWIYEVRSIARSDGSLHDWGAWSSRAGAEARLAERFGGENRAWAEEYHRKWWIEEIDTTGMFEIPSLPVPRERFSTKVRVVETGEAILNTLHIDVMDAEGNVVAGHDRNHPGLYDTFEPFRQGERMLALVSPEYTTTAVMDLSTGEILASEEPDDLGFCPVGFYVPDWWDVHDGSVLPGSRPWTNEREWPVGDFGFVWGCIWGDDGSWKVEYLDLSRVREGEIARDARFGYLELECHPDLHPRDYIRCDWRDRSVTFSVPASFDLDSGEPIEED
jgi:hypothetical protein